MSNQDTPGPISPSLKVPQGAQVATFGAGCFWGVEHMYRKYFAERGLIDCRVGYSGGSSLTPSYRAVCGGTTGHAEVAQISFDPSKVSYAELVDFFSACTTLPLRTVKAPIPEPSTGQPFSTMMRHKKETARREMERLQKTFYPHNPIVTDIVPMEKFWDAEKYHQLYLENNPGGYECPSHFLRTKPMQAL